MFGNVTALEGSHVTGKIQEQKHAAHMLQACGLGSSQGGCEYGLSRYWGSSRQTVRKMETAVSLSFKSHPCIDADFHAEKASDLDFH